MSVIGRAQLKSTSCGVFLHNSSQFLATLHPTPECVIGALLLQATADCPATGVPTPSSPGDVGDLFCNEWKSANLRDFPVFMHSYCGVPVLLFHLFTCEREW